MSTQIPGDLIDLAEGGLQRVPPVQWRDLAEALWGAGVARGEAAFCILACALTDGAAWWEEHDAVPSALAADVDALFRSKLPDVLADADPIHAAGLAETLRLELGALLVPPAQWVAAGYLVVGKP